MVHVDGDPSPRFLQRTQRTGADAFLFEAAVPAFQFAVRLGVVGTGSHVRDAGQPDELLEVAGDELRPVVADDLSCLP